MLWFGRSPDTAEPAEPAEQAQPHDAGDAAEMEVAPGARPGGERPADASGSLDDALTALDALSRATPPRPAAPDGPRAATEAVSEASGQAPQRLRPQTPTPAGRAYRRLRRIFPG